MSIIYEALKKTEEKNAVKDPASKKISKFKMIFLGLAMVGAGVFIIAGTAVYLLRFSSNSEPQKEERAVKKSANKYNLQGIIYDDDKPLAVVNGRPIGVGEVVEEALLTQISCNGVEIETKEGRMFIGLED